MDSIGDGPHSYQDNETTDTEVLNPCKTPGSSSLPRKGFKPHPLDISYHNQIFMEQQTWKRRKWRHGKPPGGYCPNCHSLTSATRRYKSAHVFP